MAALPVALTPFPIWCSSTLPPAPPLFKQICTSMTIYASVQFVTAEFRHPPAQVWGWQFASFLDVLSNLLHRSFASAPRCFGFPHHTTCFPYHVCPTPTLCRLRAHTSSAYVQRIAYKQCLLTILSLFAPHPNTTFCGCPMEEP